MPSIAAAATTMTLPDDTRCAYPGKKCSAARAVKPNGTLHKLCEVHRRRANLNQKRLQQKRRLLRDKLFKRATGVTATVAAASNASAIVSAAKPSTATVNVKRAGSTIASDLLFAAAKKPSSPAAPYTMSSPIGMDSSNEASATMSYRAQLEYLFADPLLCHSQPLDVFAPAVVPDFSHEDVFMLQDALFSDFYYPTSSFAASSSSSSSFLHQSESAGNQLVWLAGL